MNRNEQDFVLHHFAAHRLDTRRALKQVKHRLGQDTRPSLLRRHRALAALAATVLLIVAFGAWRLMVPPTVTLRTDATAREFTLPEGTGVTLAPHSLLTYRKGRSRRVDMQGRIFFRVRHDEAHPFEVRSPQALVRVLGTQFEVDARRGAPASSVTVTQGKVRFAALRGDARGLVLTRGMKAVLPAGASRPAMAPRPDPNAVAWATHEFHFSDTPLSTVLRTLGRHYGTTFSASDLQKRLTGDFDARQRQEVIRLIEETLDVKIWEER